MSHFKQLTAYIPDLKDKSILDIGVSRGGFTIEAAQEGAQVTGLEPSQEHIDRTQKEIDRLNLNIKLVRGYGEEMPFPDNSFDFVNMAELIEHVDSPNHLMPEVKRVLKPRGQAYLSVPSRYSLRDPHYELYFVNWLPRSLASSFIKIFKEEKEDGEKGRQKLASMHYFTLKRVMKLITASGLKGKDIRLLKIKRIYGEGIKGKLIRLFYLFLRPWYFDTFHILIERK